jgi:hypothetical protein
VLLEQRLRTGRGRRRTDDFGIASSQDRSDRRMAERMRFHQDGRSAGSIKFVLHFGPPIA